MDEYKINQIVAILFKNEYNLSDGYEYYNPDVSETLRGIAIDILKSIETKSTQ